MPHRDGRLATGTRVISYKLMPTDRELKEPAMFSRATISQRNQDHSCTHPRADDGEYFGHGENNEDFCLGRGRQVHPRMASACGRYPAVRHKSGLRVLALIKPRGHC